MKKVSLLLIAIVLLAAIAPQVFAVTPALKVPDIEIPDIRDDVKIELPDNFWEEWFKEHPLPVHKLLESPEISTAKFVHKTHFFGSSSSLEIRWNAIDGAEKYEVVITKADGTEINYVVESNMVYDRTVGCPKMYVKDDHAWVAATVKVRAIGNGVNGLWSDPVKIGCDMLH